MTEEIIIAGFGGQGVLSMGKILAYSGTGQDQEESGRPSTAPEMRGGKAKVTLITRNEGTSSPVWKALDSPLVSTSRSRDKFEPLVKAGGTLIYDPNGITHHPTRKDINIYQIEGARLAAEGGNPKIFNMIILGGFLKVKPIINLDNLEKGLKKSLPARHHNLIPMNIEAVQTGMAELKTIHQL